VAGLGQGSVIRGRGQAEAVATAWGRNMPEPDLTLRHAAQETAHKTMLTPIET
jgi:hypothetical protein